MTLQATTRVPEPVSGLGPARPATARSILWWGPLRWAIDLGTPCPGIVPHVLRPFTAVPGVADGLRYAEALCVVSPVEIANAEFLAYVRDDGARLCRGMPKRTQDAFVAAAETTGFTRYQAAVQDAYKRVFSLQELEVLAALSQAVHRYHHYAWRVHADLETATRAVYRSARDWAARVPPEATAQDPIPDPVPVPSDAEIMSRYAFDTGNQAAVQAAFNTVCDATFMLRWLDGRVQDAQNRHPDLQPPAGVRDPDLYWARLRAWFVTDRGRRIRAAYGRALLRHLGVAGLLTLGDAAQRVPRFAARQLDLVNLKRQAVVAILQDVLQEAMIAAANPAPGLVGDTIEEEKARRRRDANRDGRGRRHRR